MRLLQNAGARVASDYTLVKNAGARVASDYLLEQARILR